MTGPYIQANGFIHQGKATTDQRLAGNDRSQGGNDQRRQVDGVRHYMIERTDSTYLLTYVLYQPGSLTAIAQDQHDLDIDPANANVISAAVTHIAVQGFRTCSTK